MHLIANRLRYSPAPTRDQLVLLHVCDEIHVPLSDTSKDAASRAVGTGEGLGPRFQEQGERRWGGGGFLTLEQLWRRVWPGPGEAKTKANSATNALLRLRRRPNGTGKAWYPALLWQVGGHGSRRSQETGDYRRQSGLWRVPLVDEAYLVHVGTAEEAKASAWVGGRSWALALAAAREADARAGIAPSVPPEQRLGRARVAQEAAVGAFGKKQPGDAPHESPFCAGTACMVAC